MAGNQQRDYEKRKGMLENTAGSFPALSGFEKNVVIATTLFKDHGTQVGVIEAGVGHILDTTNVFSEESVITSVPTAISVDHSEILGETVEDIVEHRYALGENEGSCLWVPSLQKA
ncbi:dihydrofolate synthetase [Encephalitozoon romaleae SJ-2008]|uniref:Dihydrofolate synthetase n=1 Tax=Encephalitozoon romaleae (strain SJ-2008) TaxID=1178016 RepID=I6ZHU1_ENCRO|nr:dihydrofolate synthetase [Encephalitozoon romaleae SJ-2008]AFN82773.1 dihydrofolate synthetase [Encephalitozoon romaleae SJ-2008]